MIFTFDRPFYLFLLFLIPVIVFIHFYSLSNRKKRALSFANFNAIARIQGVDFFSKNILLVSLKVIVILLLVFSLAGMNVHLVKKSSEFSYVIAVDSSSSMEANDIPPSRFEVSKDVIGDFISEIPLGTRVGLVSFSGSTLIEQEITSDKSILKASLNNIELSNYGGTDIYESVITSSNLLSEEKYKSLIILSDGQFNVGNIDDAIAYANKHNLIIHTIALGTHEGGDTGLYISKLDEDSMRSLSYNTGGEFFKVLDKTSEKESFGTIIKLTNAKVSVPLYVYFLICAIIIFVLEYILSSTRYLNIL